MKVRLPICPFIRSNGNQQKVLGVKMMQTNEKILLGIDIGTTGAKCTFYNLHGFPVASEYQEYNMIHPKPGWVEEDPDNWWQAVVDNIKACIMNKDVNPDMVAGIGVSCTNSFIPVDENCNVLHNAIMQIDQRAADEVEWVRKHIGEERIYRITGNRIARGTFSLPTLRWFFNNRPDIMEKTHKFLMPSGFIVARLTNRFSINQSRMGFTLLGNIRTGEWDRELAMDAGIPYDKLPTPYKAYEIVGGITEKAAVLTGLKKGTPVVAGAMDTVAAAVGAGAVEEGDTFLAIGTCGRLCHTTPTDVFDNCLMNCRNALEGQWLNIEATNGAGVSLRWFRDVFGEAISQKAEAAGLSTYQILDQLAEKSAPGSGGVLYLPYISGERCPIWDPNARGVFFGIHLGTTYGDIARAIMEGVAFSIRQGMEIVVNKKNRPKKLSLGGGIARSRIWSQIFADILGYPIVKLEINETETLGDAILAAYGVGLVDDLSSMAKSAAQSSTLLQPDPEAHKMYDEYFELYKNLYIHLKDDFQHLNSINNSYKMEIHKSDHIE